MSESAAGSVDGARKQGVLLQGTRGKEALEWVQAMDARGSMAAGGKKLKRRQKVGSCTATTGSEVFRSAASADVGGV